MAVRAGSYRHQLRLEQRSAELDEVGQDSSSTWEEFATVRASVQRTTGQELVASAQVHARVPTIFRIRYREGVEGKTAMRVVFDGRVFEILSAIDQEARREEIIITTEERVGEVP